MFPRPLFRKNLARFPGQVQRGCEGPANRPGPYLRALLEGPGSAPDPAKSSRRPRVRIRRGACHLPDSASLNGASRTFSRRSCSPGIGTCSAGWTLSSWTPHRSASRARVAKGSDSWARPRITGRTASRWWQVWCWMILGARMGRVIEMAELFVSHSRR